VRDPTNEELDMIMSMGFEYDIATAAVQMANFEVPRAIDLLLTGQEA